MLEGHHFQNAYVTRDIDRALEIFRARHGVGAGVAPFEVDQEVRTARGIGRARHRLAFIWVNGLQYELIQPLDGMVEIYTEALPPNDGLSFHHSCMRVDDWDDFRARVARHGWSVAIEGASGDRLKFLYLDARDTLGHYLEYIWCTPDIWAAMTEGRTG